MSKKTGLELLRTPFDAKHIGKLPKPTAAQTKAVKDNFKDGVRCEICGGWHHPKVVHLDYVGHAALTDRLLDADPHWYWEPVAFTAQGLPAFDDSGGLWIRLYIHDGDKEVNHLGYGHAALSNFKEIGSREKEVIGDALRNAAMRFGAALDLWHKGDLHDAVEEEPKKKEKLPGPLQRTALREKLNLYLKAVIASTSTEEFDRAGIDYKEYLDQANEQWPEFFTDKSGEEGFPTFKERVVGKLSSIKREEAMDKQQREDTEFKNDF